MLASRLTKRVEITIAGRSWPVIFTHDVLLDVEEASGLSTLDGQLNIFQPSIRVLRAVAWVLLKHAGAQYTLADVGALLRPGMIGKIRSQILEAWQAAMPEPEPEESRPRRNAEDQRKRTWMDVWADNAAQLHLNEQEWLAMTPRMVQALSHARLEIIRQQEFLQSHIGAVVATVAGHLEKGLPNNHFMIHPWPERDMTGDDVVKMFGEFTGLPVARALSKRIQ